MNSFDISKMEVYLGDQTDDTIEFNPVKGKESSDDDDEDDEDDDDDDDSSSQKNKGQ